MKRTKIRGVLRTPEARGLVPQDLLLAWERRYQARHTARQHVAIRFRNTNLICDLIDLSETGARICVLDGVVPNVNEDLTLTLFDGTTVEAKVLWLREKHIGIEFAQPIKNAEERLDFESLGSAYFRKAVTLQKAARKP
jgi:hypothetical protein